MRAAERLGFTYEALFRHAYVSKGRNRDKAIFAIIDKDWPALRAAFEAWLEPANFDESGRQRSRLSELTAPHVHRRTSAATSPHRTPLGQMVGAPVPDWTPPPHPPRTALEGRYCRIEPLDPALHADELFAANRQSDHIWDYLPYGPFDRAGDYREWMHRDCQADDPLFHAVINLETGRAEGVASYLRIAPEAGSI